MKKFDSLIIIFLLTLMLFGCGYEIASDDPQTDLSQEGETSERVEETDTGPYVGPIEVSWKMIAYPKIKSYGSSVGFIPRFICGEKQDVLWDLRDMISQNVKMNVTDDDTEAADYSINMSHDSYYSNERIVSLQTNYEYHAMSDHTDICFENYTYDLKERRILVLSDVLQSVSVIANLKELFIVHYLEENNLAIPMDEAELIEHADSNFSQVDNDDIESQNWCFTKTGLRMNWYDFQDDWPSLEIPYGQLTEILKPEYVPYGIQAEVPPRLETFSKKEEESSTNGTEDEQDALYYEVAADYLYLDNYYLGGSNYIAYYLVPDDDKTKYICYDYEGNRVAEIPYDNAKNIVDNLLGWETYKLPCKSGRATILWHSPYGTCAYSHSRSEYVGKADYTTLGYTFDSGPGGADEMTYDIESGGIFVPISERQD